jgi:hypothetical protein
MKSKKKPEKSLKKRKREKSQSTTTAKKSKLSRCKYICLFSKFIFMIRCPVFLYIHICILWLDVPVVIATKSKNRGDITRDYLLNDNLVKPKVYTGVTVLPRYVPIVFQRERDRTCEIILSFLYLCHSVTHVSIYLHLQWIFWRWEIRQIDCRSIFLSHRLPFHCPSAIYCLSVFIISKIIECICTCR